MLRRPPRTTRTNPPVPYSPLLRSRPSPPLRPRTKVGEYRPDMTQRDEILRHVIGRTTSRVRLETVVSMGHRRRLDIVTAEGAATLFFDQGQIGRAHV